MRITNNLLIAGVGIVSAIVVLVMGLVVPKLVKSLANSGQEG